MEENNHPHHLRHHHHQDHNFPERKGQKRKLEVEDEIIKEEEEDELGGGGGGEISSPPFGNARQALLCEVVARVTVLNSSFSWRELDHSATKGATHVLAELAKNGLGTSFGALFLITITLFLFNVIKKRSETKLKKKFFKKNGGLLLQHQLPSNENNVQNIKLFNSKELEKATNHFSENRIVSKGGQGTVFKGMLSAERIIAIKKCNTVQEGNEKSDVYSFGVILVELLAREKPVSSTRLEADRSLSKYFLHSMKENHLFDILDDRVKKESDKEEVIIVVKLAKRCLHLNGRKCPTMREVAIWLQGI